MDVSYKTAVLILVIATVVFGVHCNCNYSIYIIVPFPVKYIGGSVTAWKRGLEILTGAHVAVNDINNDSSILSNYNLKVIVVDSGVDEYKVLEQTINLFFYQLSVNIVGISGFLSPKAVSFLLPLAGQREIVLSASSEPVTPGSHIVMQAMILPSTVVNVLQMFMAQINWKHLGIITDSTDAYFFHIADMLVQSENNDLTISPYIELLTFKSAINEILKSNTKVIFISLHLRKAVELICEIYTKELLWPKYAWIVLIFDIESVLEEEWIDCNVKKALNGILIIKVDTQSFPSSATLISGVSYSTYYHHYLSSLETISDDYNITLEPNAYSMVIYDALWRIAITLNESYYQGTPSVHTMEIKQQFSNLVATTFQIRTLTQVFATAIHYDPVAIDNTVNKSVTVTVLNSMQIDNFKAIHASVGPPIGYTAGVAVLITFTAILVTVMLVLYIGFHKEPEVKATSFSLSLLMFAGCYFNLFYIILLYYSVHTANSIDVQYQHVMCNLFLWFSAPGISLPLMLAVLLVKIIRIYYIFKTFKAGLGRCWSDLSLAGYVALILSPNILVNMIWVLSDRYHVKFEERVENGYTYVSPECSSTYESIWIGVQVSYILTLILALVTAAIITRKVRLQHFKDTKKVNILLFLLCPGLAITFLYWLLLQILNSPLYVVTIPLLVGHSS